jgi:predicted glycosyltransferase
MKIWIDLANSPQALFFRPIAAEMERRGHIVLTTVRDCAQTVPLAAANLPAYTVVDGWTTRKSAVVKMALTLKRVIGLLQFAGRKGVSLAVSHNSYSQAVAAACLGIPLVTLMDYDHQPANHVSFRLAQRVLVPEVFPASALRRYGAAAQRVVRYPGIKEEIYLADFAPDAAELIALGLPRERVIASVRPPSTALYHHFENSLFDELLAYLNQQEALFTVLLPRFPGQGEAIRHTFLPRAWIPSRVVNGPNLIYHSDLVIGAGGTMNREAAVLGTPAYTAFAGRMGAVDEYLIRQGRMVPIGKLADFKKIQFRKKAPSAIREDEQIVPDIVDKILG